MKKQITKLIGVCTTLLLLLTGAATTYSQVYCDAASGDNTANWISNVQFAGIDKDSGPDFYEDYTDNFASVEPGSAYDFSATIRYLNDEDLNTNQHVTVYIDWNQDFLFNEDDERYDIGTCIIDECIVTNSIAVPESAIPGNTRMRVISNEDNYVSGLNGLSCFSNFFAEVEDYTVTVEGDCVPPNFNYYSVDDCENETYEVFADLDDFAGNTFITFGITRSDGVPEFPLTVFLGLQGQTVSLLQDIPFDVTVTALVQSSSPACNVEVMWEKEGFCPPANNECETAIPLACGDMLSGSTTNGTPAPFGVDFCFGLPGPSPAVWYSFTAPYNALAGVTIDGQFNYQYFIYSGSCGDLDCFAGNFGTLEFNALEGETYYIMVTGVFFGQGEFDISLDCQEIECEFPEVTATVIDAEGLEITDCVSPSSTYSVEVAVEGGAGNSSYTVQVGDSIKVMTAPETHIFGTFNAGVSTLVEVIGDDDPLCTQDFLVNAEICIPENNECETAQPIACGETVSGYNIGASEAFDLEFCDGGFAFPPLYTVWYTITPEVNSVVTVTKSNIVGLNNAQFQNTILIYTGACNEFVCAAGAIFPNSTSFTGFAGVTYYVAASGFGGDVGTFDLTVECEEILCEFPDVTVDMVDTEDNIVDCIPYQASYGVQVSIAGGDGNASYTVSAGDSTKTMTSGETHIFGTFEGGIPTDVSIVGDDDENCSLYETLEGVLCPPENDVCADAIPITCGESIGGTTLGAIPHGESLEFCLSDFLDPPTPDNGGAWFVFELTALTEIDIDLSDAPYNFDDQIYLYTGSCNDLICLNGSDFGGDNGHARLITQAAAGTYYIYVSGWLFERGEFNLSLTCIDLVCSPNISAQAVDIDSNPIESCVPQDGEYYALVSLEGGSETEVYNVTVNGGDPIEIAANSSGLVGPIPSIEAADIVVFGTSNASCGGSEVISVEYCAPANDLPCNAMALPADGSTAEASNLNATADPGEAITPQQQSCETGWCDGFVDASVWFTFVAPESGRVDVSLCTEYEDGSFDSQVAIWSVEDCGDYSTYSILTANDNAGPECGFVQAFTGACVVPGETYYIQVDGFFGETNIFDISVTPSSNEICNCELPVVDENTFVFVDTQAICDDPANEVYSTTFYVPEDLGSQEGLLFTYDWSGNSEGPITILVTETTTIPELISTNFVIYGTITIPESECEGADGTIYPYDFFASPGPEGCAEDCNGVPGGPAVYMSPCDADGVPGRLNFDCECLPIPENDLCSTPTVLECGDSAEGSTVVALPRDVFAPCAGIPNQGGGLWYSFTGTGDDITASLCGANFDVYIEVFEGGCESPVCVTSDDNSCDDGLSPEVTWSSEDGVEYLMFVTAAFFDFGQFTITMSCEESAAEIAGTVDWDSDCEERDVTVSLYNPGTDVLVESYTSTVNTAGEFTVPGVSEGTFDIIVKVQGHLAVGMTSVEIGSGSNALDIGEIVNGDLNDDNGINISDFSILNGSFGSTSGDSGYNFLADLNCDGGVSIIDFSILNASFGLTGASAPLQ